jgi:PAS domain S-box-containing protein
MANFSVATLRAQLGHLIDQLEAGLPPSTNLQHILLRSDHSLASLEKRSQRSCDALRDQVNELNHRLEQLALVRDLTNFLARTSSCDDLFDGLPSLLRNAFSADAASLMLLNPDTDHLELVGASGAKTTNQPVSIPRGVGVAGSVLASGRARVSSDTSQDPLFFQTEEGPSSLLSIPLGTPDTFGVLNLSSQTPFFFDNAHRDLLSMLASPIAIALSRARLEASFRQQVKGQTRELEDVRDFFQSIVNSSDDLIVVLSPDFDMILVSGVASTLLNRSSIDLAEQPLGGSLLSTDVAVEIQTTLLSGHSVRDMDIQLQHSDSHPIHASLNASPILGNNEEPLGYLCIFRSIERRVRTHRELTRLNERLNSLFEAALEIGSSLELDEVLGRVLVRVKRLLDADDGTLLLLTSDRNHLLPWRASGTKENMIPIKGCPEGIVYRQQKAILLSEPASVRQFLPEADPRIQSCLMIPLRLKEHVLGVLRVDSRNIDHLFDTQDLRLGSTFATQAALAIENSRLYSEVNAESNRLRGLLDLTRETSAHAGPSEILDHFAEGAIVLTQAFAATAWEYFPDEQCFKRAAAHVPGDEAWDLPASFSSKLSANDPLLRLIQNPKDPLRLQLPWSEDLPWMLPEMKGASSLLVVPVAAGGRLLGILQLYWMSAADGYDQDEGFAQVLAMQAGSMIQACYLLLDNQLAREFLTSVMRSATDAIVVTDRQGRITLFNSGAEQMLGMQQEDLLGMKIPGVVPEADTLIWRMRRALRQGQAQFSVETELTTAKGGIVPVQLSLSWLKDSRGRINGLLGVAKDISQFKKLAAAHLEAERLKSIERLAVTVSDKINSPLSVILGHLDLLRLLNPDLDTASLNSLQAVSTQVDRVKEILNSLDQLKRAGLKSYALPDVHMYDLELPDPKKDKRETPAERPRKRVSRKAPNRRAVSTSANRKQKDG